jgi:hypothetical protein
MCCACGSIPPQPVTPQRPSFSSDTSTTAPGTVEFEAGVSVDDNESVDSPLAIKWGATDNAELFLGWSPYVRSAVFGRIDEEGVGDIVVGTRVRFKEAQGRRPAGAFQLTTKLPLAESDKGLGTGLVDFFGAAIATGTVGRSTFVGFYQLGILSDPSGGDVDASHGIAFAWAHPVAHNLGGFIELTGVFIPSVKSEELFAIGGVGYNFRPNVVLDAAGLVGITDDAPDYLLTVGLTVNAGKLF